MYQIGLVYGMNLTHILAFHRVATVGSFTLAARLTGVSQPTLSAQIKALEQSTQKPLFDRIGRKIQLTSHGETLLRATTKLAAAIDEVSDVLRVEQDGPHGHLRICADSAIHVVPILVELKKQMSTFRFSLRIENSAKVIAQVIDDEADVGVMAKFTSDRRLHSFQIRVDKLVLLTAATDPLARRKNLKLGDLAGRDLIVRERGSITREVTEAHLHAGQVSIGQIIEVATREAVNEAIASELGVGIVFASEAGNDSRLRAIALVDVDATVSEYVICREERKHLQLIRLFLDTALTVSVVSGWLPSATESFADGA